MRAHRVLTPPEANGVTADVPRDPGKIRKGASTADGCLRVPPGGEEKEHAEAEGAGAYLNVILPACAAATHGTKVYRRRVRARKPRQAGP